MHTSALWSLAPGLPSCLKSTCKHFLFLSPLPVAGMNSPLEWDVEWDVSFKHLHQQYSSIFLYSVQDEGQQRQESRTSANDHWKGRRIQWPNAKFHCWKRPVWEFSWMSYCLQKSWLFSPRFPGLSTRRSAVLVQLCVRSHWSVTWCN